MKNIAIIYHDHCLDGFGSAFAAWFFLKDKHNLSFHKASYQQDFPELPNDIEEVYILDFSYPRNIIIDQRKKYKRVFIIDHHETAQKELEGLEDCIFDMSHSGAYLSWMYFFERSGLDRDVLISNGHSIVPTIIQHIQDRDLWTWKMEDTEVFIAGLYMYPKEFKAWAKLVSYSAAILDIIGSDLYGSGPAYKEIYKMGETIIKYQKDTIAKNINNLINMTFQTPYRTYVAKAINSYFMPSETAHAILDKHPEVDIAVCYYEQSPGVYKYSLRSRKDSDVKVNEICKWFGGGGHPSAGGFVYDVHTKYPHCLVVKDTQSYKFIYRKSNSVSLAG